jgi:hypothetical protein
MLKQLEEQNKQLKEIEPENNKRTAEYKVQIKGNFGTFTGKYLDLTETPEYVVLIYLIGDSIYIPPTGDKFELLDMCKNEKYSVYYAGINFEIPMFNSGFIVINKMDEKYQPKIITNENN